MDEFFPSEIARLVLGYLKESKCENSWNVFLKECSSLHEYVELYNRGKMYSTNVNGKSLSDILKEYCKLKNAETSYNKEFSASAFKEKCKIILEEIVSNATEHILLKYFPSICGNNQHKNTSDMIESISEGAKNFIEDGNTTDITKDVCLVTSEDSTSGVTKNSIEYGDTVEKNKESSCDNQTPENNAQNLVPNRTLNITDPNTNQSSEHPDSEANAVSDYLTETSVSKTIYLQEIIKVEKDIDSFSVTENSPVTNISNVRSLAINENEPSVISSEWNNNLNSSKVLKENLSYANSTPGHSEKADNERSEVLDSMEVEVVKTIKQEPSSNVDCENKTTNTNCFQNSSIIASQDSSLVEITQTTLQDTQSTIGQFSNLVNNISISANQSGYSLQTTPFSNQPVAVQDLSFPSVPTYIMPNFSNTPYMQNNAQFSFVINTTPQWKDPTVGSFSLNLPSIHSNNIGPVLTSMNSLSSNNTPSVPTVCVNNAFTPAITAVDPVIGNTPSATLSFNVNPSLTTVNSTANGQSLTVTSVPSNVSSFVNTPSTVQTIPNSNSITDSAKSNSNGLSKKKPISNKMPKQRKIKNLPSSQVQHRTHPSIVTRGRKGKQD